MSGISNVYGRHMAEDINYKLSKNVGQRRVRS